MVGHDTRSGRLLAPTLIVALIVTACGTSTPTPSPTATPVPTQTPIPSVSAPIQQATGGAVAMAGGPTLVVPPGGVSVDTTATIWVSTAAAPAESDTWPAAPIGPMYDVDLGGQTLAKPATLTFHFDPAALPTGVSSSGLLVAYEDPASDAWVPVPTTVSGDAATAIISHLSNWGFFGFDPDRWLITIKALASGQITDLVSAVQGLLTTCSTSGGGYTIDNSAANKMIEGCLDGVPAKGTAAVTVTNLRAFALSLSSPRGYIDQQLVAPGASVQFSVPNTDAPPATVSATMTTDGLWWSVTDIVIRMLPGWTELEESPDYWAIVSLAAAGTKAVWDASNIWSEVAAGKLPQAAEATVTLLTGKGYLDALVAVLGAAAIKYDAPWLGVVDASALTQILKVVDLADLIVTTWSFFGDYFFNAQTDVSVSWTQPLKPPPAPANVVLNPGDCGPAPSNAIGHCLLETVSWAASPDRTSHVEIFTVASDPIADQTGQPVSCASALDILVEWLKTASPRLDVPPPAYFFDYMAASGTPGATSVQFKFGGYTDYRGEVCGFWARAVNGIGASSLVFAGDDPRLSQ